MARNPFLQLRHDHPIVDPETGLPTQYFLEMLYDTVGNAEETADEVATKIEGPAGATNEALARFDGTTGALIKDSSVTLNDVGTFNGVSSVNSGGFLEFATTAIGDSTPTVRVTIGQDGMVTAAVGVSVPDEAYGSSWNGSLEVPTKNAVYDKIETMGGGGGGGSSRTMFPFLAADPLVNSGALTSHQMIVSHCYCESSTSITGLILPTRAVPAGMTVIPVIYGGVAGTTTPIDPNGTSLVATGPAVTGLPANSFVPIPLSAPFSPTPGLIYYVGFATFGGAANHNFMSGYGRRGWFSSGTHNPAPATFTTTSNNSGTWISYWTY